MMLELLGNEVRTAHDGLEAVEAAEAVPARGDPDGRRHAAAERLRRHPAHPRAAVGAGRSTIIALTGWGQEGDRERSREAGCDGHLVKPVDLPDLEKLLAELSAGNGDGPAAHQARRDTQDADRRNR